MLEEQDRRNQGSLINLIGTRSMEAPNFALLIGAGASASSGVKTAGQMIAEWRRQMHEQSKSEDPFEEWLKKQDWYNDEDEYPILFEGVCDQPSHRRTYIENCIKDARPSWGYIYLANIIANKYFNVVFTPNFDDLVNEACFVYADLRPIVCAHDSAVADIRVTSARPKVIKLHGDFLYDSIKNTVRETENLEKNMRDKFVQFAREYGLVVVGYGGNDRSIMDILDSLLRSQGFFPQGVYWCRRNQDDVGKKLSRVLRREGIYWVEIEGFDEFMAELHKALGLTLPSALRDPYKATTEKLNTFILPKTDVKHRVIREDIAGIEKQVRAFENLVTGKGPAEEFDRLVPYNFLGNREYQRSKYKSALMYYEKALIQDPGDLDIMGKIVWSYAWVEDLESALETSEKMVQLAPEDYRGYLRRGSVLLRVDKTGDALSNYSEALKHAPENSPGRASVLTARSNALLTAQAWTEALSDAEEALQINPESEVAMLNKCLALKKTGKGDEAKRILEGALQGTRDNYIRACAFATLGDKAKMLAELGKGIKEDPGNRADAKYDSDFQDYRQDSDFRKLVFERQQSN